MRDAIALTTDSLSAFDLVAAPVWIAAYDDLRLRFANRAALSLLGCDAADLGALSLRQIVTQDPRAGLTETGPQDGQTGFWDIQPLRGRACRLRVRTRAVRFGGQACILATVDGPDAMSAPGPDADVCRAFQAYPAKAAVVTAGDHRVICATDAYLAAFGLDHTAVIGAKLQSLFCRDGPDSPSDAVRTLSLSFQKVERIATVDVAGVLRYPVAQSSFDAQNHAFLVVNKPVVDAQGAVTHIVHILARTDDTDQPASLEAIGAAPGLLGRIEGLAATLSGLRERNLRLQVAESLLGLGMWDCDLRTLKLSWSPRVFEINGRPVAAGEPDFEDYVAMTHPDDRDRMRASFMAFLQSDDCEFDFRHRIMRPDGRIAHVRGVGRREKVDGRDILMGCVLDETDAVQLQAEVSTAVRLQRMAGRMARLGGWRYDATAKRLDWTDETVRLHEEPHGFIPDIDTAIFYYVPEDRDRVAALFQACLERGEPFEETLRLVTAKGNRIFVRTTGEAVRHDDGRIVAVEGAFQDVSELLDERDKSRAQSQRLQHTLDHISEGFYLVDHDWRFAFVNSEAERLLGRTRGQMLGRATWEVFPDTVGSTFDTTYRRAVAERRNIHFEAYSKRLDAWFAVAANPTPEGLAVYFRDITKSRARDERLKLLAAAVARQNDILLITEAVPHDAPEGPRIVYVNEAFTRRTGYGADEVLGKTPRILQGPRTQRAELDRIRAALERWEPVRAELINYTKSGEEFWIELDIVPLADADGHVTHWVSIQRDISDRRRAEAAMRASEDRFRLVAHATGNAIWDWDILANKHWWSDGLTDQFGHPRDIEGNIPTVWEENLHPADRKRVLRAQKKLLEGRQSALHETYRFRCADGTWATVEDHAFLIRDADGKPVRLLGSMNNVTERVQLEERLRRSQKLEAVGQLTGGIAHDFNNLLTVILGNAEILGEALRDEDDLHMLVDMINSAADRGAELTKHLLAFSRRQPLEPRVLDINVLLSDIERLLRRTLDERVSIEIARSAGLWQTELDAGQLEAAILNLVLNARDAMPQGGVLTIETANVTLDADYAATEIDLDPGQYVVFVITDTGHGMTPEIAARVFEPFFTTKDIGKGSGLGLSMVFGFVKQSGGHIRIYSEPGEGTAMKLYFPRARVPAVAIPPKAPVPRVAGGTEVILVVEDEALVREHVVLQLSALGYTVMDARNGPDALDILAAGGRIDLLFTDMVMPGGISGRDLAAAALRDRPDLKVLYTSGYTENSIVHQGRLDQGVELLSKPYRRDHLAAKIRKVLDGG